MTRLRLLLLLAIAAPALAQAPGLAPSDAYTEAAGLFIDGEKERAEAVAEAGLQSAPDDAKLQALLDLIRQEQPPQDSDGGEPNDEGDPDDSSDSPQDSEGDQQQDGQQNGPEDERQEAEQDQTRTDPQDGQGDETDDETEPRQPEGARPGEGGDTPRQAAPTQAQTMSAEQAGQILDAVGGEERLLLREMRRRPTRMRRSDKDW